MLSTVSFKWTRKLVTALSPLYSLSKTWGPTVALGDTGQDAQCLHDDPATMLNAKSLINYEAPPVTRGARHSCISSVKQKITPCFTHAAI